MSAFRFQFRKPNFKALFDIRARLILLALILVVPLMLDRVRTLEQNRTRQINAATTELLDLARHGANAQRDMIKQVQGMLRTSAAIFLHASRLGRPCALLEGGLKVQVEGIGNISVASSDGRIICSTNPRVVGIDVTDRAYFHQALAEKRFVLSDYVISKSQSEPSVVAAFPTSAIESSSSDAVVITSVTLSWLEELISRFPQQSGITISLVDSEGVILAAKPAMPDTSASRILINEALA
ncbi:MAG: GGDEF domain-containing protein, partial [Hyphomicrobiales bacterium]